MLEPGEGLDPGSPDEYLEDILEFMNRYNTCRLVYDLQNTPVLEEVYYAWLCRVNAVCRLNGAQMVVVSVRPATAFALAIMLDHSPPFHCARDVDNARGNFLST